LLSVAAIAPLVDSAGAAGFASFFNAGAFATGAGLDSGLGSGLAVAGGAAGDGSVGSFFSTLDDFSAVDDFSALDVVDMLDEFGALEDGADPDAGTGDGAFALTERDTGGGFIQSSTYGTATAPNTPRTIRTRTTRNHVAAKMERGGTSSYRSWSSVGSSRSGLTVSSALR